MSCPVGGRSQGGGPKPLASVWSLICDSGGQILFLFACTIVKDKENPPQPSVLFLFRGILVLIGANRCPGSRSQCRQWHWRKVGWLATPAVSLCPPHGTTFISHQHWPPCEPLISRQWKRIWRAAMWETTVLKVLKVPETPKASKVPKVPALCWAPVATASAEAYKIFSIKHFLVFKVSGSW